MMSNQVLYPTYPGKCVVQPIDGKRAEDIRRDSAALERRDAKYPRFRIYGTKTNSTRAKKEITSKG